MSFLSHATRPALGIVLVLCLIGASALVGKEMTSLRVVVTDDEGEPVARASVILSRLKKSKKAKVKGEPMQLKTSQQGTAPLPPLPQGRYVIQVISQGFQTYGDEITLDQTEQTVTVQLQPPQNQFSVHVGKK